MSGEKYTFTFHNSFKMSPSEMKEIALILCNIAIERKMGFTVEEVGDKGARRLTHEEVFGVVIE